MENRSPDFMLEEYRQIANAYQDLHAQQNELVKFYVTLVAVPTSVLAVVTQVARLLAPQDPTAIESLALWATPALLVLMVALCIVGFMLALALVATRAEAVLYVRTVNCVRRYFVERDPEGRLSQYLVLPDYDTVPRFSEGLRHRAYWNVAMVSALNSGLFLLTVFYIISWIAPAVPLVAWASAEFGGIWVLSGILACVWFGVQRFACRWIMANAERRYDARYSAPYPIEWHIGLDLDGVLGDLAGRVVEVAAREYGIHIKREDITSHRLEECTDLSADQVTQMFRSTDAFQGMRALPAASTSVRRLRASGWTVHILTDRFWTAKDWSSAKEWLEHENIDWDHLNLVRAADKPAYASAERLRIFIEDNYETAVNLASVCEKVYLLDYPYNQGPLPANVVRVARWQEMLDDLANTCGR